MVSHRRHDYDLLLVRLFLHDGADSFVCRGPGDGAGGVLWLSILVTGDASSARSAGSSMVISPNVLNMIVTTSRRLIEGE